MASKADIEADLAELQTLLGQAKRARVQELLTNRAKTWQRDLDAIVQAEAAAAAKVAQSRTVADDVGDSPTPATNQSAAKTSPTAKPNTGSDGEVVYRPIEKFGWDQGDYNSEKVSVYITSGVDGVGSVKDQVTCAFTKGSFDLKIIGLNGVNHRLLVDNLDKEIDPEKSKFRVKENRVTITLQKIKGEYSYEHWNELRAKKGKGASEGKKSDPTAGIMDMMKDMYDNGDDQMKKTIGEAMMKSQQKGAGGMGEPGGMDDF